MNHFTQLSNSIKYYLRPCYGSDKLLVEFILDSSNMNFNENILCALSSIHPKIDSVDDLWMNNEILFHISSDRGDFLLSKEIWDSAFILTENNQFIIKEIDNILSRNDLFEKIEVDFTKYKLR